jgi:hypothetical protein
VANDDLSTQQRLINQINEELRKQTVILQENVTLEALISAELRAQQTGRRANLGEEARKALDQTKAIADAHGSASSDITATGDAATSSLEASSTTLAGTLETGFERATKASREAAETWHSMIPDTLRAEYRNLQELFGGLGPNLLEPVNQQAEMAANISEKSLAQFRVTTDERLKISGMGVDSITADFGKAMEYWNYSSRKGVDGLQLLQDATDITALEMLEFGKGLGLTADEVHTFVSRSVDTTGQATTDMLYEVGAFSKAIQKTTGVNSKYIAKSIEGIIRNTERYGNIGVEEAARIAGSLAELRIEYKELDGMLGKFQGFESAATAVGDLTSVFGVQMDAMEMMKLANTDQEAFLKRMREAFLATGKSVHDMSLAEKQLIKDTLNLSDPAAVERFLDPTKAISSMEELKESTDMTDVSEGLNMIKEDIATLDDITKVTAEASRVAIEENLRIPLARAFQDTENNMVNAAKRMEITVGTAAKTAFGDISAEVGTSLATGVSSGIATVEEQFEDMVDSLEEIWEESDLAGRSASPVAMSMVTGFAAGFDAIKELGQENAQVLADVYGNRLEQLIKVNEVANSEIESSQMAHNSAYLRMSEDAMKEYQEMKNSETALTDAQFREQLEKQGSYYSMVATELGYSYGSLSKMSEEQKNEAIQNIQSVYAVSEQQAQAMLESSAASQGASERAAEAGSSRYLQNLKREYGSYSEWQAAIGVDAAKAAMKDFKDVGIASAEEMDAYLGGQMDISASSYEARQERLLTAHEKRVQAEATAEEGAAAAGDSAASGVSAAHTKVIRSQTVATEQLVTQISTLNDNLTGDTASTPVQTTVTLDGDILIDYITDPINGLSKKNNLRVVTSTG